MRNENFNRELQNSLQGNTFGAICTVWFYVLFLPFELASYHIFHLSYFRFGIDTCVLPTFYFPFHWSQLLLKPFFTFHCCWRRKCRNGEQSLLKNKKSCLFSGKLFCWLLPFILWNEMRGEKFILKERKLFTETF